MLSFHLHSSMFATEDDGRRSSYSWSYSSSENCSTARPPPGKLQKVRREKPLRRRGRRRRAAEGIGGRLGRLGIGTRRMSSPRRRPQRMLHLAW
uniref:Uncharacterized protein n=1 Tax=Arundo donax TaxID=35708 RepID=A0A0A9H4S1_ARUDO